MSRISEMIRSHRKYNAGDKVKFKTNKSMDVKGKVVRRKKYKTYTPGTHINLKGKVK